MTVTIQVNILTAAQLAHSFINKGQKRFRKFLTDFFQDKVERYEIEGYMDRKFVRVVLEVENKGRIVENIYDKAGKGIYVYDEEGSEYNILIE